MRESGLEWARVGVSGQWVGRRGVKEVGRVEEEENSR